MSLPGHTEDENKKDIRRYVPYRHLVPVGLESSGRSRRRHCSRSTIRLLRLPFLHHRSPDRHPETVSTICQPEHPQATPLVPAQTGAEHVHWQGAVEQPTSNDPRRRVRFPDHRRSRGLGDNASWRTNVARSAVPTAASAGRPAVNSALNSENSRQPEGAHYRLGRLSDSKSNGRKAVCVVAGARKALAGVSTGQSLNPVVPLAGFEPAHMAPEL